MRLVMLGKQQLPAAPCPCSRRALPVPFQGGLQIELFLQPDRHGRDKGAEAPRRIGQVGLQQPLELDQRLVVEDDLIDIGQRDTGL